MQKESRWSNIKTIINNIKKDLKEHFAKPIEYEGKQIEDFIGILIKEAYEENPKISYPAIEIQEIDNSENLQYSDNMGEQYSNLSYQITAYTRNIASMQANEAVRLLGTEINKVLGGKNYKMNRLGNPTIAPTITDNTILQYNIRYSTVLSLHDNRLYKS